MQSVASVGVLLICFSWPIFRLTVMMLASLLRVSICGEMRTLLIKSHNGLRKQGVQDFAIGKLIWRSLVGAG